MAGFNIIHSFPKPQARQARAGDNESLGPLGGGGGVDVPLGRVPRRAVPEVGGPRDSPPPTALLEHHSYLCGLGFGRDWNSLQDEGF